jgi:crotonobetainyl-CoA:carnitine CoA-transferase CaiB-like acyl-CoA transferase
MNPDPDLPLSGIKVLDLSRLLPGPYASLVLADLGARVDKVEEPGGDGLRSMPPLLGEESALFIGLNRNKRSLVLNLKDPVGADAFRRLVVHYDILIESFRPGVMDRLGLSYQTLQSRNPGLIYCAISGYGQTGPDRLKAGHDLNYIARAGVLGYGGEQGGAPAMPGVQIADVGGGSLFALVGILAALQERHRTGAGRFVDVSMTEGALAFLHMHLAAAMVAHPENPLARGGQPLNGGYACYNIYPTSDGRHLSVGALEPKFFLRVCQRLGRPELVALAYDSADGDRAVRAELTRIFSGQPLSHWLTVFEGADACVEPVLEGLEVLDDPQLRARGAFVGSHLKTPLNFGPIPIQPSPSLGQHSREILREAGFSGAEIDALRDALKADWPER